MPPPTSPEGERRSSPRTRNGTRPPEPWIERAPPPRPDWLRTFGCLVIVAFTVVMLVILVALAIHLVRSL